MKLIRQPEVLALVGDHFRPLLFVAKMDSLRTINAMLMDETTGESLVLTGIPCGISLTTTQVAGLINSIELDIAALRPGLLHGMKRRQAGC